MKKNIENLKFKNSPLGPIPNDWEVKKVAEVCGFIVPDRNKPELSDDGIPWITTPDLMDINVVSTSKSHLFVSLEDAKKNNLKVVPKNSVIMTCVGDFGIVALTRNEIIINQQLHAFLPSKLVDSLFLATVLRFQKKYFGQVATKTAVPYLNKENCNSTPIPIPSIQEQQSIAKAISTWDKAIDTINQLIVAKEQRKKWLMQQLLTGKKRLKGFSDVWSEVSLGELIKLSSGDAKPERVLQSPTGSFSIPVYGGNGIMGYSNRSNKSGANIIIGRVGEYCGVTRKIEGQYWVTDNALCTVKIDDSVLVGYLSYKLQYIDLSKVRSQGGQPQVSQKPIYSIKIKLPSTQEQKSITRVLETADKEINLLKQKLEAYKEQKKGLMQVLLTGKVRLKIN